jgi:hypothetical protein
MQATAAVARSYCCWNAPLHLLLLLLCLSFQCLCLHSALHQKQRLLQYQQQR